MPEIKFNKKFNKIENKQLAIFSSCLATVSILNIIGNLFLKLPITLNIALFFVLVLNIGVIILARKNRLNEKLKFYYFILLNTYLLIACAFTGGLEGSTPVYFFLYFCVGILTISRQYLNRYILYFCITCFLSIYIEFFQKAIIQRHPNETARAADLILTFIVTAAVLLIMLVAYKKVFLLEQKALLKKTIRLEESKKELIKAKNIALSAVKSKSNFLSNMSHEIRTPLNGIIGSIDLLRTTNINNEQSVLLNNLAVSSNVLIDLVNDILDISKIEADKLSLKIKSFDLQDTLKTLEILTHSLIKDKDIAIKFSISENTPQIIVSDGGRLKQILINLLGNATKFTIRGEIEVFVDFITATNELEIKVKDTGIGIRQEDFNKLFLPFSQIENQDNTPYGGVGLGLLISAKLIKLLGGSISFTSEFGKGSVFSINFPVKLDLSAKEQITKQEKSSASKNLKSIDILIAEDNQINQLMMSKMLQSFDCYYSIANNGAVALELVKNQTYDIILMDIQMPVKDGITATKDIIAYFKEVNGLCPIIIGCSANAFQEDREKCLEAGMVDLLVKPIKLDTLKEALQKWI